VADRWLFCERCAGADHRRDLVRAVAVDYRSAFARILVLPKNGYSKITPICLSNRALRPFAAGTSDRAFALGNGSTASVVGGPIKGAPTPVGNNTAISLGNGANSYAGAIPSMLGTNSPNNQFAFAGPGKNAVNAINP
jgi:hypothetical protein